MQLEWGKMFKRVVFAMVLMGLPAAAFAAETASSSADNFNQVQNVIFAPVKVVHESVNRALPMATVWDSLVRVHGLAEKDWLGYRHYLEQYGLTFSAVYTGDFAYVGGGVEDGGAYLGNLDLTLGLDTEKAGLWKGGTLFLYGLENHGSSLSGAHVGDKLGVSNIEASQDTFRLFEIWYEQKLLQDRLSVLVGQQEINTVFMASDYAGFFINGAFGVLPTLSGNMPTPTFPVTGPGARVIVSPWEFLDLKFGVYDGNPGTQERNRNSLDWNFDDDDGVLMIAEGTVKVGGLKDGDLYPGRYSFGGFRHTAKFDDLRQDQLLDDSGVPIVDDLGNPVTGPIHTHGSNYGIYGQIDQMIWREKDDQGLGVFFMASGAPNDRNDIDLFIGTGMHYKGFLPWRDEDTFGAAVAYAETSNAQLRTPGTFNAAETVVELSYRAQVMPWLAVQPDFQWVRHPSADVNTNNAAVFLLRFEVSI